MAQPLDANAMGQALATAIGSAQVQAQNNTLVGEALSLLGVSNRRPHNGLTVLTRGKGSVTLTHATTKEKKKINAGPVVGRPTNDLTE